MDRISALLPMSGWTAVVQPADSGPAPATRVEPVAAASPTSGGLGTGVDTRAGREREGSRDSSKDSARDTAQARDQTATRIDPDAPSGPPPAFDVSPLEAELERLTLAATATPAPQTQPFQSADGNGAAGQSGAGTKDAGAKADIGVSDTSSRREFARRESWNGTDDPVRATMDLLR